MKKSKEDRAREKLAALLGIEVPSIQTKEDAHEISMEAEATLEYYDNPRTFTEKACKHCGRHFATRGAPVAYCSDECRIATFEERMGVRWSPLRSKEQRWGFLGEPLTVPPEALTVVKAVAQQPQETHDTQDEEAQRKAQDLVDLLRELGID